MKVTNKIGIICLLYLSLSSCSSSEFTMDSMMRILKGDSPVKVQEVVNIEQKRDFTVSYLGKEYFVKIYPIKIGQISTSSTGSTPQMSTTTTSNVSSDYFFLFSNDKKLIFWGFLHEFSKSEDSFISEIAPILQEKYYF